MIGRPRNTGRLYSSKKRKLNDKICFIKKIKVHLQNVFMEIVWGICQIINFLYKNITLKTRLYDYQGLCGQFLPS